MLALIRRKFICFLCLSAILPATAQVQLFVAPNGNDKHPGTVSKPFKNLHHAIYVSLQQANKHVVLNLRNGVYELDRTIQINATDFKPASLKITAYNKEGVTISAGKQLQLRWTHWKEGIYVAKVPSGIQFERLYVNDKPQHLARYPNYDSTARVFNGTAADAISPERVKHWKNPVGGYVHALHGHEWGGFHYRITGSDSNGNLELEGGWQNNRPNQMHKTFRFVENVFEELDAPGEWWLDRINDQLYYYPAPGVSIHKARITVSQFINSIELKGTPEKPLKNLQITGIRFSHNERSFMLTREPLLRSDWTIFRGAAILLDGTEHTNITQCKFEGLGGNAVFFSNYNRYDSIRECHISFTGASAICFIGDTKAVRSGVHGYDNHVPYPQLDMIPGPLGSNFPQDCVAENNLLHDVGLIEKQATAVQIQIASAITVRHNSIYNTSRAGINIGDGSFGGHVLEYNDVFNTVRETGDHGSFNSWGRDRFWAANRNYMDSLVAVHPELINMDAQRTTVIRNNRFRCDHGWDIDLDDGSSNYHIYNNLCLNGGIKLREGFNRVVENNIMVNNSFHPHVWFVKSNDIFRRNVVMRPYAPIGIKEWGQHIDNNFFPDSAALHAAQANGTDKHSVYGHLHFVNHQKGDYSIAEGSPVFTTGFKNFSMHVFGVQFPPLKKIALAPDFPFPVTEAILANKSVTLSFLGGAIKSIDGPGDRSAYGLPDETGVLIVSTGKHSLLKKAGLKEKDVIRTAGGKPIYNIKDLMEVYQALNWTGNISIGIVRDQQALELNLHTK